MDLEEEQTEYLGDAINDPEAISRRCIDLLKSRGLIANAAWPDPTYTSTSDRHCLRINVGDGNYYGHGDTERLAAIDCFIHLWFRFVTVPNAPDPTEEENALFASGRHFSAIESYMNRTGEDLRIARSLLATQQ
ncbi:MAG: hypothetical protein EOP83_19630 [Verrucomicrobiaceae bacterium]|nr:MAG: hypothetical protein EOP83_19630 [Verrucomicrobiaceae bacterium]